MLIRSVRLSLILVGLLLLASGIWRLVQTLDGPTPPPRATLVRLVGTPSGAPSGAIPGATSRAAGAYFPHPFAS